MPSLGLLLEQPIFGSYNLKVGDSNANLQEDHPDYRLPIEFDKHQDEIEKFKDDQIYSRMRMSEERVEVFDRWIRSIDSYAGPDLLYYNAQGVIPDAAVMKKGEKRNNPFREKKRFDATEFSLDGPATAFADDVDDDDEKEVELTSKRELEEAEG